MILRLLRAFLDGKDRDGVAWSAGRPHRAPGLGRCPDDDGKDAERGEATDAVEEPSDGKHGYTV